MSTDMARAPLDQSRISASSSQYWRVSVVDLTQSTHDDLAVKITSGEAKHGDVIVANYQSAGRGRLDRTFTAPPSTALLFSLYLTPQRAREDWGFIPLLAGYSIADTLIKIGAPVQIKWPNDLLINEEKLGGIISTVQGDGLMVGIGFNVSSEKSELPVEHATSLALAGVKKVDRNFLLPLLLNAFEKDFTAWDEGATFLDAYSQISATLGREVTITVPGGHQHRGLAASIDILGQLHLADGTIVSVGDVIHLR